MQRYHKHFMSKVSFENKYFSYPCWFFFFLSDVHEFVTLMWSTLSQIFVVKLLLSPGFQLGLVLWKPSDNFKKASLNISLPWRKPESESWGFWVLWSIFNIILKIFSGFYLVTLWNFTHFKILSHIFETSSFLSFREDTLSNQRNGSLNRCHYFYICTSNTIHLLANF